MRPLPTDPVCVVSLFDLTDCGAPGSPMMFCPVTGCRILRSEFESWRREIFAGFQIGCPRCGVGPGLRCVKPSGTERRYVTTNDSGHHADRKPIR